MLEASQSVQSSRRCGSAWQRSLWSVAERRRRSVVVAVVELVDPQRRGNNSRITECVGQFPPGAAVEGRKTASPETKNISWLMNTKLCMTKFSEWAKSRILQQSFAVSVASLFRTRVNANHRCAAYWLAHLRRCITFYFRDLWTPAQKIQGRGRISLLLPPGAENRSYATG